MAKLSDINLLSLGNTLQLSGAVYIGDGKVYLALFPEDKGHLEDSEGVNGCLFWNEGGDRYHAETLNMTQEDWAVFLRQTDLLETEVLSQASDGTLAKVVLRKSQRTIEQGVSWKVFKRDNYSCRYCGADDVPLTVDHLVCWEEGGPSTVENLVAADRRCNKTRGNLPYAQWLEHPYYKKVSLALTTQQRDANLRLLEVLPTIQKRLHQRSR